MSKILSIILVLLKVAAYLSKFINDKKMIELGVAKQIQDSIQKSSNHVQKAIKLRDGVDTWDDVDQWM